jgi:Protein of unknown function (DUF3421)
LKKVVENNLNLLMKNRLKSILLANAVFAIVTINNIGFGAFDRVNAKQDTLTDTIQQIGQQSPAAISNYQWIPGSNGSVPILAIGVGNDNGDTLYVCRANNINGKLHPRHGKCYIPYGGKEQEFRQYEVLIGNVDYVLLTGSIPQNAIIAGSEGNGSPLYVCMTSLGKMTIPGKYNAVNKVCYVPYGGKEHEVRESIFIAIEKFISVTSLNMQDFLVSGKSLYSKNKSYQLIMQTDGNLVLYDLRGGGKRSLWSSGTSGKPGAFARLVNELHIGDSSKVIWSSGKNNGGRIDRKLVVQNDGNVVIYGGSTAIWATNTVQR